MEIDRRKVFQKKICFNEKKFGEIKVINIKFKNLSLRKKWTPLLVCFTEFILVWIEIFSRKTLQRRIQSPLKHLRRELIARIPNGFQPLTIFVKGSVSDVWQSPENTLLVSMAINFGKLSVSLWVPPRLYRNSHRRCSERKYS